MKKNKKLSLVNTLFLTLTPILTIALVIAHYKFEEVNHYLWLVAVLFYFATGLSITGGYHRLFAHRAYKAHPIVKFLYLVFGAAAFQNSCYKWASDHRIHHNKVDTDEDPYNINEGFFYAHMGWIFYDTPQRNHPKDLRNDKLVMWQDKHYLKIAIIVGILLPTLIGYLMGSVIGGLAIPGLLRIVAVHHFTFTINSLAHMIGRRTFSLGNTARDSGLIALVSFGEGYHNFHHKFQMDYRNGIKFYHFDPTKWLINVLSYLKLARGLKKTKEIDIVSAKLEVEVASLDHTKKSLQVVTRERLEKFREKVEESLLRLEKLKKEYKNYKFEYKRIKMEEFSESAKLKLEEFKRKIKEAKREYKEAYGQWKLFYKEEVLFA